MTVANPNLSHDNPVEAAALRLKRAAAASSMAVGIILIILKLTAYFVTNSVSLLSTLMDSVFDTLASLIVAVSIVHAASPADENHRFGHGKVESLSALAQAVFIFGSAGYLMLEAVNRLLKPEAVKEPVFGLGVMAISMVLTLGLILFQRHVIRRTQSIAITADHMHYKGDLLMNASVMASLGLTYFTSWPYFDALFALLIGGHLLWATRDISIESFNILMDRELPDEARAKIIAIANAHPQTVAVHDLRTRSTGDRIFIEFHLEMEGAMTLYAAHDVTEQLEKELYAAFPKAEVMIHQEPAGLVDHRLDEQISRSA